MPGAREVDGFRVLVVLVSTWTSVTTTGTATSTAGALLCENTCWAAEDGLCDDGRVSAHTHMCELGTDCKDCGPFDPKQETRNESESPPLSRVVKSRWWNPSANMSHAVIRVGALVSLGRFDTHGTEGDTMQTAYRNYFNWLNSEQGGVKIGGGRRLVEFISIDDKSDPSVVHWATYDLIDSLGVNLLLGPFSSKLTWPAAIAAQEKGALLVSPTAASSALYRGRDLVFGLWANAQKAFLPALKMLEGKAKTVVYIEERSLYPISMCKDLSASAARFGMTVLDARRVSEDANKDEMRQALGGLQVMSPDVLFTCVNSRSCEVVLEATRDLDFNVNAIVTPSCDFASTYVRPDTFQYSISVSPWNPSVVASLTQFASTFAVHILVNAIEQADSVEPVQVAAAMQHITHKLLGEEIQFDSEGQNSGDWLVGQWQRPSQTEPTRQVQKLVQLCPPSDNGTNNCGQSFLYPKPKWSELRCYKDSFVADQMYGFASSNVQICRQCETGEYTRLFEETLQPFWVCTKCQPGKFFVQEATWDGQVLSGAEVENLACQTCKSGKFAGTAGLTGCHVCDPGKYQSHEGKTACNLCMPGHYNELIGQSQCKMCNETQYSAYAGSSMCETCPEGGLCLPDESGAYTSWIHTAGYYLMGDGIEARIIKCRHGGENGEACQANRTCYRDSEGVETMYGPMCGICRDGYGRKDIYSVCEKCPPLIASAFLATMHGSGLLVISCVMITLTLMSDFTRPKNIIAVIVKQILNYMNMAMVVISVTEFNFGTKSTITSSVHFLSGAQVFDYSGRAFDCFGGWLFGSASKSYQFSVLLGIIGVPLWCAIHCLIFFIVSLIYTSMGFSAPSLNRLVTALVVCVFVVHPRNAEYNLVTSRCEYFDKFRLFYDTRVECQQELVSTWWWLGMGGFILYALGIPLLTGCVLRSYKKRGRLSDPTIMNTLGFLYNGFEEEYYYFESILMLRKVTFQIAVLLPGLWAEEAKRQRATRCMTLLVVAVVFLAMHMGCQPYDNRAYFTLDRVESASLWAILMTLLVQTWALVNDDAQAFEQQVAKDLRDNICLVIVVIFHLNFCLTALWLSVRPLLAPYCIGTRGMLQLEVCEGGLRVKEFHGKRAKRLLEVMFGEIARLHIQREQEFMVDHFGGSIQHICIDAMYHRQKDNARRPVEQAKKNIDLQLSHTPLQFLVKPLCEVLDRSQRLLTDLHHRIYPSDKQSEDPAEKLSYEDIEKLKEYNFENYDNCIGAVFTVEELHMAVIRLNKQLSIDKMVHGRITSIDVCNDELKDISSLHTLETEVRNAHRKLKDLEKTMEEETEAHEKELKDISSSTLLEIQHLRSMEERKAYGLQREFEKMQLRHRRHLQSSTEEHHEAKDHPEATHAHIENPRSEEECHPQMTGNLAESVHSAVSTTAMVSIPSGMSRSDVSLESLRNAEAEVDEELVHVSEKNRELEDTVRMLTEELEKAKASFLQAVSTPT